jgi:hypothetical protein
VGLVGLVGLGWGWWGWWGWWEKSMSLEKQITDDIALAMKAKDAGG